MNRYKTQREAVVVEIEAAVRRIEKEIADSVFSEWDSDREKGRAEGLHQAIKLIREGTKT